MGRAAFLIVFFGLFGMFAHSTEIGKCLWKTPPNPFYLVGWYNRGLELAKVAPPVGREKALTK